MLNTGAVNRERSSWRNTTLQSGLAHGFGVPGECEEVCIGSAQAWIHQRCLLGALFRSDPDQHLLMAS
jgi:hypothetical protein